MNYTQNYQLPQWEKTDRIMMDDFNHLSAKTEEGLTEKTELYIGSYTGDDSESRTIPLPFTPRAVYLCNEFGQTYNNGAHYGGLALEDTPAKGTSNATGQVDLITITENGFIVQNRSVQSGSGSYISANVRYKVYHYLALK